MVEKSKIAAFFTIVMMTSFATLPAEADPVRMLMERDWGAYRYDDKNGRICFASSVPKKALVNTILTTAAMYMCLSHTGRARPNATSCR